MHHHYLDRFSGESSAIHRLDPRVKLVLAALFSLSSSSAPPSAVSLCAHVVPAFGAALLARIPLIFLLRRCLFVLPFALAAAILLLFRPGETVLEASTSIIVTREGLVHAGAALGKSMIAVLYLSVLASTTRIHTLLAGLAWLKVPGAFLSVLAFLYRYLFVVVGEALRMERARAARLGAASPLGGLLRSGTGVVAVLFLRSYERSERIHRAMAARGFSGEFRSSTRLHMHRLDWFALGVGMVSAAVAASIPFFWARA